MAMISDIDPYEDNVVEQLRELLEQHLEYSQHDGEEFFDAIQNARVIRATERYYRIMYRNSAKSWNLRDRHMFETLQHLLHHHNKNSKTIIWTHNSHIENASTTSMD